MTHETAQTREALVEIPDELTDAAVFIALLASLEFCDREYQADWLLSHRNEIVSIMRVLMGHALRPYAKEPTNDTGT